MRVSLLALLAISSQAVIVTARLHQLCWCEYAGVKDSGATENACTKYRNRNTGDEQWDKCPDCKYDAGAPNTLATCASDGWHLGGDEWNYYCKQGGAKGYCD